MSFFDDVPELPERPRQPQPIRPGWFGPPSDELPGILPIGAFVYQSAHVVVALKMAEVYSTGCLLDLKWSVRRVDESAQEWRDILEQSFSRPGLPGIKVGVSLADGSKAIASHPTPAMLEDTEDVSGPVLTHRGGGGGSAGDEQVEGSAQFWLWPLPVEGDIRIVAKWDELGVPESSVVLSGARLVDVLGTVQNYWAV
ncbi:MULTISPECIES: hypothetical protein [unclassified Paenarthrobacter]|uniref:hypothetical protein n=1 Tax=unclassified Paenarthrobacter TaxID=2634190 RepID=UPI001F3E5B0D|nr:hypothetical protein [Paenarthrobacter sp. AR 02]MCF3137943.1 hypothetical protein [Paenarthrobacter sp. AR 02]